MSDLLNLRIQNKVSDPQFIAGVVVAKGVVMGPSSPELLAQLDELVARRAAEAEFPPLVVKDGIRTLLKRGGFKASGRNKPASEYLAQAAREGRFPRINNLVDINNLLSLESGFPVSLLDLSEMGGLLTLRYGREGEKYIFNSSGQEIDLRGLISMCGGAEEVPLGNAVKDSMRGKLKDNVHEVVGVIYTTRELGADLSERLGELCRRFGDLLKNHAGASEVSTAVVGVDAS